MSQKPLPFPSAPPPSVWPISLLPADAASMPADTALALAEALLASGRKADALALSLAIPFEDKELALAGVEYRYGWPASLGQRLSRALGVASQCDPRGHALLLDAIEARGASTGDDPVAGGSLIVAPAHRAEAADALDKLAARDPEAAREFVARAPAWLCLHKDGESYQSYDGGLRRALSGAWPLPLVEAYLERDGLASRMARQADVGRETAKRAFAHCPPQAEGACMALLARACDLAQEAKAQGQPPVSPESPLPRGWAGSVIFGPSSGLRELMFSKLGRAASLAAAAAEGSPSSAARDAAERADFAALAHCFEAFGPALALRSQNQHLSRSLVAHMAHRFAPDDFGRAIDLILAGGPDDALALRQSCEHRFWVVQEKGSSVRKMGDALAYCAAEGLIGQAEELLARQPALERKDAKAVLAYMQLRDTSKKSVAHAGWESLLLREVVKAARKEPCAPGAPAPRKNRL